MHAKFDRSGRFADPSLLILASLAGGAKHGYAIMLDVAEFSGVSLEPGTLYAALARLEREGWIEPEPSSTRRRPYRVTAVGQSVLREQLDTVSRVVAVGQRRLATA
jgi:DNA-binding PadR family transcriptional regulator